MARAPDLRLLLTLVCAGLADRTLNVPGCENAAYVNDDKYLSCPYSSSNAADISCEGFNASTAPSLGGSLVWCVLARSNPPYCIDNLNYTNSYSEGMLSGVLPMNITDTGLLYITRVSLDLRGRPRSTINCSIFNSEGILCGASTINILLHIKEDYISAPPTVFPTSLDRVSIIGAKKMLCRYGDIGGTNGSNFWTVGVTKVPSFDISALTNHGNSNTTKPVAALCSSCSCSSDYLSVNAVRSKIESDLERTGFASFIAPIFEFEALTYMKRLCYGLENRYISVLVIEKVEGNDGDTLDVSITITSAQNISTTEPLGDLQISYFQPAVSVDIQLFPDKPILLNDGADIAIVCNATTAGDSSASLEWAVSQQFSLVPKADFVGEELTETNLTSQDIVESLCQGKSGVFSLPLQSFLAPSSTVDPNGAVLLNLRAALLVCDASSSLSNSYWCRGNTTNVGLSLIIPSSIISYVIGCSVALVVVTVLILTVILWFCGKSCHSKRHTPAQMDREQVFHRRRPSMYNPTFDTAPLLEYEFSRDQLRFISILGEGQFGQVWKATAEGICPQDANRTVVAVKTLKANASDSDRRDLESELMTMKQMESHPNITNFLGMCSETDSQPLLILMEFAMYGSLRDYLKQLRMGNLAPFHPNTVRTSVERGGAGPCTCQEEEGEGEGSVVGGRRDNVRQEASQRPFSLYDSSDHDPAVLAHAARLMRLLESDYYYQAARHGNGTEQESCGSDSGSDCTSVDRGLYFEGGGMCAYHLDLDESPYRYRMQQDLSGYYNSQGAAGSSDRPMLLAPAYANLPPNEGVASQTSSCHCSDSAIVDVEYRNVASGSNGRVTGSDERVTRSNGRVTGSGGRVTGSGGRVTGSGGRVTGSGGRVTGSGGRVTGSGGRVTGSGGRVTGSGGRVTGSGGTGNGSACGGRCKCLDVNMTRSQLSYFEVLDYANQIARGMEHLENMKCLHRDLAARNVLIAEGFLLKIGDFGLSRQLDSWKDYYRKLTPGKIPARWMALESLEERTHTSKSDVWSYGVVLWEVLTYGDLPYAELPSRIESLTNHISRGHRLAPPPTCTAPMYELLKMCWDVNPDGRPAFIQLAQFFSSLLENSPDCLNMTIEAAALHPNTVALESELLSTHFPPRPQGHADSARGRGVAMDGSVFPRGADSARGRGVAMDSGSMPVSQEYSSHSSASGGDSTLEGKINTRTLWRNTEV